MNDPQELFRNMFAIVGHDEKEQEELSKELFGKILAQAIYTVIAEMPKDQKEAVTPLFASGAKQEEIIDYLQTHVPVETMQKHISASSFTIVKTYLETIDASLTDDQRKSLSNFFQRSMSTISWEK